MTRPSDEDIARMREALEFYGQEWTEVGVAVDSVMVPTWELERDAGHKARSVLTALDSRAGR